MAPEDKGVSVSTDLLCVSFLPALVTALAGDLCYCLMGEHHT